MTSLDRRARRRAERAAARVLVFLALLAALVLIVAARAQVEAQELAPAPDSSTVFSTLTAETAAPEDATPAVSSAPSPTPVVSSAPSPTPAVTQSPAQPYDGITVGANDVYLLACLVWHESRGEPYEGQVAVAEVVLNRCLSPLFPDTIEDVIFQRYPGQGYQFSPAPYLHTAQPGETQYSAVYDALDGSELEVPLDTVFFSTSPYNSNIVAIIGNHYFCTL